MTRIFVWRGDLEFCHRLLGHSREGGNLLCSERCLCGSMDPRFSGDDGKLAVIANAVRELVLCGRRGGGRFLTSRRFVRDDKGGAAGLSTPSLCWRSISLGYSTALRFMGDSLVGGGLAATAPIRSARSVAFLVVVGACSREERRWARLDAPREKPEIQWGVPVIFH